MTANLVGGNGEAENAPSDPLSSDATFATSLRYKDRRKVKAILNSMKKGSTAAEAAKAAGIDRITLWRWCNRWPRLAALVDAIQETRINEVEDAMFKAAAAGNVDAGKYLLSRRKPEKYPERSLLNQTINIGKQGKNDDREFEGRDADEQRQLTEYFKQTDRDSA